MIQEVLENVWFVSNAIPLYHLVAARLALRGEGILPFPFGQNERTTELERWCVTAYEPVTRDASGKNYRIITKYGRVYRCYEDGTIVLASVHSTDTDGYSGPYRYPTMN